MIPEEPPKTFIDKRGDTFQVAGGSMEDYAAVAAMYDAFVPMAVTQGLPPIEEPVRHAWISRLLKTGENMLARHHGKVVGHASVIPSPERGDAEYLIFVDRDFRNRGVGTQLTVCTIERARSMGLESIWLTVEALNFRAIKLYRRMGFVFCDVGERERTMMLRL